MIQNIFIFRIYFLWCNFYSVLKILQKYRILSYDVIFAPSISVLQKFRKDGTLSPTIRTHSFLSTWFFPHQPASTAGPTSVGLIRSKQYLHCKAGLHSLRFRGRLIISGRNWWARILAGEKNRAEGRKWCWSGWEVEKNSEKNGLQGEEGIYMKGFRIQYVLRDDADQ